MNYLLDSINDGGIYNDVAVGPDGKIYCSCNYDGIRVYDLTNNNLSLYASKDFEYGTQYARKITLGPDGKIYLCCGDYGLRVFSISETTITQVAFLSGYNNYINTAVVGPDGKIYVCTGAENSYNYSLKVYTLSGSNLSLLASILVSSITNIYDITLGPDGKIYVCGSGFYPIKIFTLSGSTLSLFTYKTSSDGFNYLSGIKVDNYGNIYCSNNSVGGGFVIYNLGGLTGKDFVLLAQDTIDYDFYRDITLGSDGKFYCYGTSNSKLVVYSFIENNLTKLHEITTQTGLSITSDSSDKIYCACNNLGLEVYEYKTVSIIYLEETSFDAGEIDKLSTETINIPIRNDGNINLEILATSNSSEFIVYDSSLTIAPDETQNLVITFDPTSSGNKSGIITITTNDINNPILEINVYGSSVGSEAILSVDPIVFNTINKISEETTYIPITNEGNVNLEINISSNSTEFIVSDSFLNIVPGNTTNLGVTFDPASLGSKSAIITLTTNDTARPTLEINVSGNCVNSEASLSIEPVDFEEINKNSPETIFIPITNNGNENLEIEAISSTTDFVIENSTLIVPPGQTLNLEVTFDPASAGVKNATITLITNDPINTTLYIDVSGECISSEAILSIDTIDFQNLPKIESEPLIIPITNDGNINLEIQISSNNSEFIVTPSTLIVPPGQTLNLEVTFDPASAGDKSAIITLITNDTSRPTLEISVEGTCISPEAVISVDTIDFQNLPKVESEPIIIPITNNGNENLEVQINSNSTEFVVSDSSLIVVPGTTINLEVIFDPLSAGLKNGVITLITNDTSYPILEINVEGTCISPEAILSIEPINFENIDKNATELIIVPIRNYGNVDLEIQISSNSPEFVVQVSSLIIAPGNTYNLEVTFDPSGAGLKNGVITLITNDTSRSTLEISVEGLCNCSDIVISVDTIDFQEIEKNEIKTIEVPITNNGNINLEIQASSDNPNFIIQEQYLNISPIETYNFKILFYPTTLGYKSGVITITTNDTSYPVLYIDVEGTSLIPAKSKTNLINYAVEIYSDIKDIWTESSDFGIKSDCIRLITGRPGYTGNDTKFYSSNEIDIEGNDISNLSNDNEYFEGLLTKDGLSGPSYSIDVETTTNLNLDSNFNFSIRNDTGFLNYLNSNEIILNNRKVKFWVIINNIFYSAGFGEISNISQSEDAINFSVEKSFKNIEKQIPNTYTKVELDEESGEFEEVVMPIVLGDVDHSMLLKEETKKLPIVISGVDKNITPAIYYDWFDPIHYEESWTNETGYYPYIGLYTNDKIFAENDPEIMGEPVGEYPYTYPNRKWLFVKYGEKAPKGMFRIKGNSASVNGTTYIHLEENLTNEDDEIINPSNFNSSLTINPLVYSYVHDTYLTLDDLIDDLNLSNGGRFYIYANDGYDTGDHRLSSAKGSQVKKWDIFQVTVNHPYPSSISYVQNSVSTKLSYGNLYSNIYKGNEKTWWFQIVDININTIASSESSVIIQNNEDGEKIAEIWNDDLKKYENIIDIVDVNSTENKLLIKGNKVLEDETIYNYKRLPFKLLAFGACVRPEWIWSNNGFSGMIYYNNQSAWNSGYFTTFEQEDLELVTNNKRNTTGVENKVEWLGYTSGMSPATHYSYIHAKFEVNKTIEELPDNVYFLVDVDRCSSEIRFNMRIGILQWYAYDIYGNLIYSNNSGTTLSDTTWVLQKHPTISHYNMFPNEFYADEDLNGDDYTMFDAAANEGTNSNKKQLKMQLNLKKSEIPIKFDNVLNNDIIKEFVVVLGFYHEWLNPSDWSKFKIEIKQLGIIAEEELHISDDDIFVKVKGERCSLTSSAPNAETNNVYTAFVHLLEDYCKIPKSLIDYDEMQSKRFNWNIGRTLTERKNAVEYFDELASNSFVQVLPTRQGKIKLKVFDYFNNFQQPIITEKYYGDGTFDIYTTYSQIEICRELRTYKLKICYKTNEQIGTDEYSYLYEYSGDFEDNGINMLTLYYNGEVIYIVGYMNLGLDNGFITILLMLNEQIHFVTMDYINTYNDHLSIGFPEVTTLHDNNIIIKDSLSDVEVTDISETYNNFKIKYNFDDNLNKFISEIAVNKVDELDEFPEENGNWESLVSGLGNLGSYEFCKFFWNACKESYNINGSLNEPQSDVEELLWLQNSTFSYPSGEKTAIKYFKLIVQWLTKQKHIIEYSVPINNETIVLELLDIVKFKDVLLTNGQEVTSFIVNKSINVDYDLIDLKIMFLPTFTTDTIDTIFETGIEENEIEESGIEENEIQEE